MTHSNISRFKNILAIIVFIIFIIIEFFYIKNNNSFDDIFKTAKVNDLTNDDLVNEEVINVETYREDGQDIKITTMNIILEKSDADGENVSEVIFATVSETYFEDALFIGDSRMEGFKIYKRLNGATYYCNPSFGVYSGFDRTMDIPNYGVITLNDLLYNHKFGKIYIGLGINNIRTSIPNHKNTYEQFLMKIKELQPDALIFLIANLHVTRKQDVDKEVNNKNINLINDFIKDFADNEKVFYLDPNILYVDEEGFIEDYLSNDGLHVKAKYYDRYLDFLLAHGIKR